MKHVKYVTLRTSLDDMCGKFENWDKHDGIMCWKKVGHVGRCKFSKDNPREPLPSG